MYSCKALIKPCSLITNVAEASLAAFSHFLRVSLEMGLDAGGVDDRPEDQAIRL